MSSIISYCTPEDLYDAINSEMRSLDCETLIDYFISYPIKELLYFPDDDPPIDYRIDYFITPPEEFPNDYLIDYLIALSYAPDNF